MKMKHLVIFNNGSYAAVFRSRSQSVKKWSIRSDKLDNSYHGDNSLPGLNQTERVDSLINFANTFGNTAQFAIFAA